MSNKRRSKDFKALVHAPGEKKGIGLCGDLGRTSNKLERITCLDCGRRAQEAVEALEDHLRSQRADAALAAQQPAPWWVTDQQDGGTLAPRIGAP
jgi:hypothetical protein